MEFWNQEEKSSFSFKTDGNWHGGMATGIQTNSKSNISYAEFHLGPRLEVAAHQRICLHLRPREGGNETQISGVEEGGLNFATLNLVSEQTLTL
ncbi:hypothetical protein AVEN_71466-1 [Araneus ventricosus]|uniref:Uncharacterized protein n=1 Tax=Araneus ventricosus TaxID=182803 RepID=A0A4Y2CWC6_ARAVE|nr:hypothetical protein AVEN_71466-1 [Araneus ventricosus]